MAVSGLLQTAWGACLQQRAQPCSTLLLSWLAVDVTPNIPAAGTVTRAGSPASGPPTPAWLFSRLCPCFHACGCPTGCLLPHQLRRVWAPAGTGPQLPRAPQDGPDHAHPGQGHQQHTGAGAAAGAAYCLIFGSWGTFCCSGVLVVPLV